MPKPIRELLERHPFLTNAGTETFLIFQQGFELPDFCAFTVFADDAAWAAFERDFLVPTYEVAARHGAGLLLDSLVWRAQPDFVAKHAADGVASVNRRAVSRLQESVARWRGVAGRDASTPPFLVTADVGPRGDGYQVADADVTPEAAAAYHREQVDAVAEAGVDLLCALTMTSLSESIGIARAAIARDLPLVVSPTVETDGRLPDGRALGDFVGAVDDATGGAPLFYMVNCAHPSHLRATLDAARAAGAPWLDRLRGFRSNASSKSHAELDESTELDRGDVAELAREVASLREAHGLRVVGGCCGTDPEHLAAIAAARP